MKKDRSKNALAKKSLRLENEILSPSDECKRNQLGLRLESVEPYRQRMSSKRKVLKQKNRRNLEKQKKHILIAEQNENDTSSEPLESDRLSPDSVLRRIYARYPPKKPEPKFEETVGDFVSCVQLHQFMKPQYEPLIIDIRSKEDYGESRIKSEQCINIPADQINNEVLFAMSFEKLFIHDKRAFYLFDHRSAIYTTIIVILDWRTTSSTLFPDNSIRVLRNILKTRDPGSNVPKISILDGGYAEWLNCYPSCVTNLNVQCSNLENEAVDKIFECAGVDNPDFLNRNEPSSPFNELGIKTSNDLPLSNRIESLHENIRSDIANSMTIDDESVDTIKDPHKFVNEKMSEDMDVDDDDDDDDDQSIFDAHKVSDKSSSHNATTKPGIKQSSKSSNLMRNRYPDSENLQLGLRLESVEQSRQKMSIERKVLKQKNGSNLEKQKKNILIAQQNENGMSEIPLKSDRLSPNTDLKRLYSSPNLAHINKLKVHHELPKKTNILDTNSNHENFIVAPLGEKIQRSKSPIGTDKFSRACTTGLENLGNSCYMNSVIQCLSNNICLAKYFNEDAYSDDLNSNVNDIKQGQLAGEVARVIKALWRGQYESISPRDLKATIGQHRRQFDCDDQQDSHEFLVFLLEWLHDDLKKENDLYLDGLSDSRKQWLKEIGNGESIISELFIGQLQSSITCAACGNGSFTYETFSSLSLSLPNTNRCTLDDCVKKYLTGQEVSDWKCYNCKATREATKKFDFVKLPQTVVIHLNRFADSNGSLQKSNTFVDFPLSDFNLASYIVDDEADLKNPKISYDFRKMSLYAASVHFGTMNGGHYMSYCRNVGQTEWYQYDDQHVSEVLPSQVKNQGSSAYLLFYTAIEND